ncbi:meiotic recombination [Saitoella coloradoensis]
MADNPNPRDTIRILIATDNHVGYLERDPVRGNDSMVAFDEVMQLAKSEDVDMVLLGGDLFHENKPSRKALYQCMRSIRLNSYGDKPCELRVLSDQSVATEDTAVAHLNYEDPDINVAIPVFSIHGNHDDPSGEGRFCALDILQVAGLVNYFGRVPENDDISVRPILLQKGETKLALYGLSNVRDERLFRSFRDGKVRFMRPAMGPGGEDEWFNLIAVHQNHTSHTETGYLPESFIQDFFDMVLWGHEHDCHIEPRLNTEQNFHVIQPGSSVATSLSAGESIPKHVGVLSIHKKSFSLKTIRLKSVRPFVIRDISLSDEKAIRPNTENKSAVTAFLIEQVEECIGEAIEEWREAQDPEDRDKTPPLPLVRLRVDYAGGYDVENPQRFSNRFVGKVANSGDVVLFHRKRAQATRKARTNIDVDDTDLLAEHDSLDKIKIQTLVNDVLSKQTLAILAENGLGDAISQYVDKDDKNAVKQFVDDTLTTQMKTLMRMDVREEDIDQAIEAQKEKEAEKFAKKVGREEQGARKRAVENDGFSEDDMPPPRRRQVARDDDEDEEEEEEEEPQPSIRTTKRAPAAKKAAPARKAAATSTRRGRGNKAKSPTPEISDAEDDIIEDEEDDFESVQSTRRKAPSRAMPPPKAKAAPARRGAARQSQLTFSQPSQAPSQTPRKRAAVEISDDEDDGFESMKRPGRR